MAGVDSTRPARPLAAAGTSLGAPSTDVFPEVLSTVRLGIDVEGKVHETAVLEGAPELLSLIICLETGSHPVARLASALW